MDNIQLNMTSYKKLLLFKNHENNKIIPNSLNDFINKIKTLNIKNKKFSIKRTNIKTSWLTENKFNQDENQKLMMDYKKILNKINNSNFKIMKEELIKLNINTNEQLQSLVDEIFNRAVIEKNLSDIYAKLCFELLPVYIIVDNEKKFFRIMFINKCQHMFENISKIKNESDLENSVFNNKAHIHGILFFVGELYNHGIINNKIIYSCMLLLLLGFEENRWNAIEQSCILIQSIKNKFIKNCPKDYDNIKNELIKIKKTDIPSKEKFLIMDILE